MSHHVSVKLIITDIPSGLPLIYLFIFIIIILVTKFTFITSYNLVSETTKLSTFLKFFICDEQTTLKFPLLPPSIFNVKLFLLFNLMPAIVLFKL